MKADLGTAPLRARGAGFASLTERLFRPVDFAAIATFRIMFGALMMWEVWRYFSRDWIGLYYLEPGFLFSYYGFDWLRPWPGDGMYWHFGLLGALAVLVTLGLFYRVAIVLLFFAITYVFLLDQARYLNHIYLVTLVAFLLCFIPASRGWSLDAVLRRQSKPWVPLWTHWLLLLQFEIMYIFAGLVKINGDWLRLQPLRMWLQARSDIPLIGPLFLHDWVVAVAAYGTIALHVIGAPLLLWKRTRIYVFVLYALFHLANHVVFTIGIFPWIALAGTLLFFGPDWPRRVWRRVGERLGLPPPQTPALFPAAAPPPPWMRTAVPAFMLGWAALQTAMPLRHYLYPGNVSWHEQGHRFAWQMKLRQKRGDTVFEITDPATARTWIVEPDHYLSRRQERYMAGRPDMILQFAHHLERIWIERYDVADPQVRVMAWVSLNGREPELLIDPSRDLSQVRRSLRRADWILPLRGPLPTRVKVAADGDQD